MVYFGLNRKPLSDTGAAEPDTIAIDSGGREGAGVLPLERSSDRLLRKVEARASTHDHRPDHAPPHARPRAIECPRKRVASSIRSRRDQKDFKAQVSHMPGETRQRATRTNNSAAAPFTFPCGDRHLACSRQRTKRLGVAWTLWRNATALGRRLETYTIIGTPFPIHPQVLSCSWPLVELCMVASSCA
jgi:hypothetical protein